jgi:hypothetical protein
MFCTDFPQIPKYQMLCEVKGSEMLIRKYVRKGRWNKGSELE